MFGFKPRYFKVSERELMTMLPRDLVDQGKVYTYSTEYKIPYHPERLIKKSPTKKYIHDPDDSEEFNCVQMVRIFKGWLASKKIGTMGIELIVTLPNGQGGHNMIAFLDYHAPRDKHGKYLLTFVDLQTCKMISKTESDKYIIHQLRA